MTEAQHITVLLHRIATLEEENKNLCDIINIKRLEFVSMSRQMEDSRKHLEKIQNAYRIVNEAMASEAERIENDWKENPDANYINEISMLNRIQSALVDYWKEVK